MLYEISDDEFRVLRGTCLFAYQVLRGESPDVASEQMQQIRDVFHRLESQRAETQEGEQEPAAPDVPEGQGVLVLGDKAVDQPGT
jgi:hypothetical protein